MSMDGGASDHDAPAPEVLAYYGRGAEEGRLRRDAGRLEQERTKELLRRYLPPAPAVVYDVGGGPGLYACWLARRGYAVHLIDPVPLHVEQALAASAQQPEAPLASAAIGDARRLARDDDAGAVLLFGPLYHLTERRERVAALREARRVVRPGGTVLAVGIGRFASLLDGFVLGLLADPAFWPIVQRDVAEGQHRNPTGRDGYFTTAFLHHPAELAAEVAEAGLIHERTVAIEGPAWLSQRVADGWDDEEFRGRVLAALRWVEEEPTLLGSSAHLMAVAQAPSGQSLK